MQKKASEKKKEKNEKREGEGREQKVSVELIILTKHRKHLENLRNIPIHINLPSVLLVKALIPRY